MTPMSCFQPLLAALPAAVLLTLPVVAEYVPPLQAPAVPAPQVFPLSDAKALVAKNVQLEPVEYLGRKAVRLTQPPGTAQATGAEGIALLANTEFQDGTIEADFALKITTPPGVRMPGFMGIAFRARPDGSRFDQFYVRPGNGHAEDQAMRNHAVQYVAHPAHPWFVLRPQWPWVYEAGADIQPETWFRVRIDVAGRAARLYIDDAKQPVLIVDGLKGTELRGGVGLTGFPGQEAYFANLRITHAPPQAVTNGGEAAGTWQVRCSTDRGMVEGTLQLRRDGTTLTGTYSGSLGQNKAITGTWRDGYVELTFPAEWKEGGPNVAPVPATVRLAGWIDGGAGKGRMRVEHKADGQWMATRTS